MALVSRFFLVYQNFKISSLFSSEKTNFKGVKRNFYKKTSFFV
ncbi:hypothetical protein D3I14_09050 [Enterococcus faecalis]|nr:hypothetical protein HMPREF9514_02551 [Enterococcus faecalis TX0855]EGO8424621.1 hypothetical protein [Enterococcus faecalis]EPH78902.1 hypothetical protein D926_00152 [Enterococcus faecalis D811610-10]KAJ83439.1 hypothetical protein P790_1211 [Enterococcus faecalis NJ44]EGO8427587.1 hypothetical protein [Enterococcus faecalis]